MLLKFLKIVVAACTLPLALSGCLTPSLTVPILGSSIATDISNATISQEEKDRRERWIRGEYVGSADISTPLAATLKGKKIWFAPPKSIEINRQGIMCRLDGRVRPPRGITYAEQIQAGLVAEAQLGGVYDENPSDSTIVLTLHLTEVNFKNKDGEWTMSAEVSSGNGKSISVSSTYKYDVGMGFVGSYYCAKTRDALLPTVQQLVSTIYSDPGFAGLVE